VSQVRAWVNANSVAMLVAFASGKGGVGKTTCAVNLAAALRALGHDPVLLDADSGGDATWLLGFRASDVALDVLRGKKNLSAAVVSTEGVRLLPASPKLIELEASDPAPIVERLKTLSRDALVLLDLPPGFSSAVTRAGIAAADLVLVPLVAEPLAERRGRHVLDMIEALGVSPRVYAIGVMVDRRRALTSAVLESAREGGLELLGEVPRSVAVPESGNEGVTVLRYAPTSPVAGAYRELAAALAKAMKRSHARP